MRLDDLKWLIPMVIGSLGFVGCIVALFLARARGWALLVVTVLSAALLGGSIFNKLSLTKEGLVVETAQANLDALQNVKQAIKLNSDALQKLSDRVDQIAKVTSALGTQPQTPNAISNQAQNIAPVSAEVNELVQKNRNTVQQLNAITEAISKNINALRSQ